MALRWPEMLFLALAGGNFRAGVVVDTPTGIDCEEADDGNGRADGRELQLDGDRKRPRPGRLLGRVVPAVPDVRAGLREVIREAPGRGVRQGRHRGAARGGGDLQHHLHSHPDDHPRQHRAVRPARRAAGEGARGADHQGRGPRHERGPGQHGAVLGSDVLGSEVLGSDA